MFPRGVGAYVDLMQDLIPEMRDGTVRTAIDTGCGVSCNSESVEFSYYVPKHKSDMFVSLLYLLLFIFN